VILRLPLGLGERDPPAGFARLPHAQQPHPVEAIARHGVEPGVGHIVERRRTLERPAALVKPRARVHLIEQRMRGGGADHRRVVAGGRGAPACPRRSWDKRIASKSGVRLA